MPALVDTVDAAVPEPIPIRDASERLLTAGASALNDAELLAVLWGQRDASQSGLALADAGGLKPLCTEDAWLMQRRDKLGARRAAALIAAVEIGRRIRRADERPRLTSPSQIYRYLAPTIELQQREVFHVLCFNPRNVLLVDLRVAEGSTSSCPVDPREVFRPAIVVRATAIVVAHNHPSGSAEPSREDVSLTTRLAETGHALGISVLDHIVIGDGGYTSLRERGLFHPDR